MIDRQVTQRRDFLKSTLLGAATALTGSFRCLRSAESATAGASRVSLMAGEDHADNVFRCLKAFERQIAEEIRDRRVVIKPNNVAVEIPLAATHANCLEATLEFLKSIGKLENAVIAESAGNGPTWEGFVNYGYDRVAKKYGVKLIDLDQEPTSVLQVFDQKDFRPHAVRMSKWLLDPNHYIISAAKMKTHDRILATLSLKNIVFGAPVKDAGFRWGKGSAPGTITQKPIAHGSGIYGINYNLFALAQKLRPHLAIIDGFEGMEGNGPTRGTPVNHRVCVASRDWLAADRVAVELMGIDFAKIGYLNFCAQAELGQADLSRIEIIGPALAEHIRPYKLHEGFEKQLAWMTPPNVS